MTAPVQPTPAAKPPPSKGAKITAGILTAIVAIACATCGIKAVSGSSDNTPTQLPAAAATTAAAVSNLPSQMICQVDTGSGAYYLLLTSASDHNFTACDGAAPYAGDIDTLLGAGLGVDRRCFLDNAFIAQFDASGAVYSDTKKIDLAAAHDYCAANGGTN